MRAILHWFRDWRAEPQGVFRQQLDTFRDTNVDGDKPIVPPRIVEGMDKPERDETKRACVHLYQDIDVELAQAKRANLKVKAFKARGSK